MTAVHDLVVADIGGTNARFALARIDGAGGVTLAEPIRFKTADHAHFADAWDAFDRASGARALPSRAAIAIAGPTNADAVSLTNNRWRFSKTALRAQLGLERLVVLNDFAAIAYAAAHLDAAHFAPICGPARDPARDGVVTVLGPGTGLGVAQAFRCGGRAAIIATEGGHIGFAPRTPIDHRLLHDLAAHVGRVSAERILSGPGIAHIYRAVCVEAGAAQQLADDIAIWREGLGGADAHAAAAVRCFLRLLGSFAGDLALAHGAYGVVVAGGLGARLGARLATPAFTDAFVDKGRFKAMLEGVAVSRLLYPEPGLFGAAIAFREASRPESG
jgi:glucokinase